MEVKRRRRHCIIQEESLSIRQVLINIPIHSHESSILLANDFPYSLLGNVYIADSDNDRIRKVTVSTGIITTIAGTGSGSYGGDGSQATSAALYYPGGVAVDSSGTQYTNSLARIKYSLS